jgi:hypothetical protein
LASSPFVAALEGHRKICAVSFHANDKKRPLKHSSLPKAAVGRAIAAIEFQKDVMK